MKQNEPYKESLNKSAALGTAFISSWLNEYQMFRINLRYKGLMHFT